MEKREKAWLGRKVVQPEYSSFLIENKDELTETIVQEMGVLFPKCRRTDSIQASIVFELVKSEQFGSEGFCIEKREGSICVNAQSTRGLLYGFFRLYLLVSEGGVVGEKIISIPNQPMRMLNHWDNFDGSIERGYAGESIFYQENAFRKEDQTIQEYARLLASIGINALSINNVNVHEKETFFITKEYLPDIKRIAAIFSRYGIQTFLSINFASPIAVGGLDTANPLDRKVRIFWQRIAEGIYQEIPDFGGFVVKADSEGEPGPFAYGCDHDDGANMLAEAVEDFGGKIIWRCFVYDCRQDWRDRSIDRAKAAYDHFLKLDGKFARNVILQIKNGPIDFQVREPVSPLFGALKKTNQILEFQITQEYTGQQRHACYLLPMWKEVLDFDTKHLPEKSEIKHIFNYYSIDRENTGISAVVNVGMDTNWTGHKLAQANLFGYGKLVWDNELSSEEIARQWIKLTFDLSEEKQQKLKYILLTSRQTYENYTAPCGVGFMVRPNHHYGPDVDGYEYDRWGTYHFADRNGIGVDRTLKTGTGYTKQYAKETFLMYEDIETCPDNLVLFFHHIPYTQVLKSGKTLIQHIYDTHFDGLKKVEEYRQVWQGFASEMEEESFQNVATRLEEQQQSAREWCDQINTYFFRKSGVADEQNRKIYP